MDKKKEENFDKYIKWFSELSKEDINIAGGKAANLSEIYNNGFPVPLGFVITSNAFSFFITQSGLKDRIDSIIETIDMENTEELAKRSREIRGLIEGQVLPNELKDEILEAYHILSSEKINSMGVSQNALNILKNAEEPLFVAVRSSATSEDLASASYAGQQESFLNIKGESILIEAIKRCISSLYTARAIYYRDKNKATNPLMAVIVMKMIDSDKSGVIFSRSPIGTPSLIAIESAYGLGEGVVLGKIKPDHYLVNRSLEIESITVSDKQIAIVRKGSGLNEVVRLTPERSKMQVLSNGQIVEAANFALRLEQYFKSPQNIEFAVEGNKFYIVQTRPVTTLNDVKQKTGALTGKILLEGIASSPGVGVGVVKLVRSYGDLIKVKKGDIIVSEITSPEMVVSMMKCTGIVTDEGGMTSHAAIVAREMGIPCVAGTIKATQSLRDGMKITVDGTNGKVYEGEVLETKLAEVRPIFPSGKVKLKLILDLPELAERSYDSKIDSIGLLKIEAIISSFEKHPLLYLKENNLEEYKNNLVKGIDILVKLFNSAWIRTSDIRSDEYSTLRGAPERELNPMMGLHGVRFSLKYPKLLEAELSAISIVASKNPTKKFGVLIPQVISIEEVKAFKEYFNKYKTTNMDLGVIIETPSAVHIVDDLCKEDLKLISIGMNDLIQYTLAVDRGDEGVSHLFFDSHPSIFSQIRRIINTCRRYKVETSIYGQITNKDIIEMLFKEGISSICVTADSAYDLSKILNDLEIKRNKEIDLRKSQAIEQKPRVEIISNKIQMNDEPKVLEIKPLSFDKQKPIQTNNFQDKSDRTFQKHNDRYNEASNVSQTYSKVEKPIQVRPGNRNINENPNKENVEKGKVLEMHVDDQGAQKERPKFLSPFVKKVNIDKEDIDSYDSKPSNFVTHKSKYQDKEEESEDLSQESQLPGLKDFKEITVQNIPDITEIENSDEYRKVGLTDDNPENLDKKIEAIQGFEKVAEIGDQQQLVNASEVHPDLDIHVKEINDETNITNVDDQNLEDYSNNEGYIKLEHDEGTNDKPNNKYSTVKFDLEEDINNNFKNPDIKKSKEQDSEDKSFEEKLPEKQIKKGFIHDLLDLSKEENVNEKVAKKEEYDEDVTVDVSDMLKDISDDEPDDITDVDKDSARNYDEGSLTRNANQENAGKYIEIGKDGKKGNNYKYFDDDYS